MLLCLYIVWLVYAFVEGKREAFYFSAKVRTSHLDSHNEHALFAFQRGLVLFIMAILLLFDYKGINLALIILSFMLSFPFWHDGSYYSTRHNLDKIYPYKWFDQSSTSTALTTKIFTPAIRTILYLVSSSFVVLKYFAII